MDLNPMRDDYRLVRRWWAEADGWSEAELAEVDAAIKADVALGDEGLIACWAGWLAKKAIEIREFGARVRDIEARAREKKQ